MSSSRMQQVHREFYTIENAEAGVAQTVTTRYLWDAAAGQLIREKVWSHHPNGSDQHVVDRSESQVVELSECPTVVGFWLKELGIQAGGEGAA